MTVQAGLAWGWVGSLEPGTSAAAAQLSEGLGPLPGMWGAKSVWRMSFLALVPPGILRAEHLGCGIQGPGAVNTSGKEGRQL